MWSVNSWQQKPASQAVPYDDQQHLDQIKAKLGQLPPIVHANEVDDLKAQLAEVAENKRFLLQGGDCAELFEYCAEQPIMNKLKVLLQMSLILIWGGRTSVVRIARMAGQYAKPRSKPTEIVDGKEVLAFRGENVNGMSISERKPDPARLLSAYFHSASTVNYVRSLLANGFADLHHPESWNLDSWGLEHVRSPGIKQQYQTIVNRLLDAMDFMRTIGVDQPDNGNGKTSMNTVDMFMSHEALVLDYESTMTRKIERRVTQTSSTGVKTTTTETKYYNLSAHFLWIGDRTRQLDGAHVEYFRGIANPIGLKVGPSMKPEELVRLLDILDPHFETGKVTLIGRFGASKIRDHLPGLIKAVQETRHKVVWCCDPMHGNTEVVPNSGYKTRKFENIVSEVSQAFRIHKEHGSRLGGVHFELTGDRVTEVTGGSMELKEEDLPSNYQTFCDPRLNYEQSLDIAFLIAKYYEEERSSLLKI